MVGMPVRQNHMRYLFRADLFRRQALRQLSRGLRNCPGSRIDQHAVFSALYQQADIWRLHLVNRQFALAQFALNLLLRHIRENPVHRISERSIIQRNAFNLANFEMLSIRCHELRTPLE
jgi:signal transduction histidine kinase